jgi:hypothetical protein
VITKQGAYSDGIYCRPCQGDVDYILFLAIMLLGCLVIVLMTAFVNRDPVKQTRGLLSCATGLGLLFVGMQFQSNPPVCVKELVTSEVEDVSTPFLEQREPHRAPRRAEPQRPWKFLAPGSRCCTPCPQHGMDKFHTSNFAGP